MGFHDALSENKVVTSSGDVPKGREAAIAWDARGRTAETLGVYVVCMGVPDQNGIA